MLWRCDACEHREEVSKGEAANACPQCGKPMVPTDLLDTPRHADGLDDAEAPLEQPRANRGGKALILLLLLLAVAAWLAYRAFSWEPPPTGPGLVVAEEAYDVLGYVQMPPVEQEAIFRPLARLIAPHLEGQPPETIDFLQITDDGTHRVTYLRTRQETTVDALMPQVGQRAPVAEAAGEVWRLQGQPMAIERLSERGWLVARGPEPVAALTYARNALPVLDMGMPQVPGAFAFAREPAAALLRLRPETAPGATWITASFRMNDDTTFDGDFSFAFTSDEAAQRWQTEMVELQDTARQHQGFGPSFLNEMQLRRDNEQLHLTLSAASHSEGALDVWILLIAELLTP